MQVVNIEDLRRRARRRLPKAVFEFIDGGAQDEATLAANRQDFARLTLKPRALVDVSDRSQETTILGRPARAPLILAPTGLAGLLARKGEISAARAAEQAGIPFCLSTNATCSIEEVAQSAGGDRWFQLYVMRDREMTRRMVERARASGYRVLCVTVDLAVQGQRERDQRNGFTVPPRVTLRNAIDTVRRVAWMRDVLLGPRITFANFAGTAAGGSGILTVAQFVNKQFDASVTWKDIAWLKSLWGGPLAIKGILSAEDARIAVDNGADALVVSNHGGRQLDGVSSAVAALPEVVDAASGRAEIILDGGVRRGSDVVKAIALGARACMIGRAFLYGLAAGGQPGVAQALRILHGEIDHAMALLGRSRVDEIDRSALT